MNDDLDLVAFRACYRRFLRDGRILLTGHSHQAWPDVARDALTRAFDDAAAHADDKWGDVVMPKVAAVGRAVLGRLGFASSDAIAFGSSTHELVFRLLSCLPFTSATHVVTTTSEFHSLHRQLTRLAEAGVRVTWVPSEPREGLAERILDALVPGVSMLALSAVLYDDAYVVPRLGDIVSRAHDAGALVLLDAYHAFNVVPLDYGPAGDRAFVTAGGYKYAAFGEGLCWMRIPSGCELRPVETGWFADFEGLDRPRASSAPVAYGGGGARFAGSTFDPTAFYRGEAALAHWDRFGLTPARLRAISLRQTRRILDGLDAAGLGDRVLTAREDARRGGFVTVRVPDANRAVAALRAQGVFVDARDDRLRLGPAPYLTDDEIDRGTELAAKPL